MILCNHCKHFNRSKRECNVITVNVMGSKDSFFPMHIPNGIKDVTCNAFEQKKYSADVKYFCGNHLFTYNFKIDKYGRIKH